MQVLPRLRDHLTRLYPDKRVISIEPLGPDTGATAGNSAKAAGYGLPVKITLEGRDGVRLDLVWRTASSDEFGHDRRADRAANMLLAFDDFHLPDHVESVDVGAIDASGELISTRGAGEHYLITTYAPGTIYAEDLRRIARSGKATALDLARVDTLADYLAKLHSQPLSEGANPVQYRRAIRDLIGHGEGIFGMIDGFPPVAGASPARLRAIERRCVDWRWRLREHENRLARIHGDFHPFNVVFGEGTKLTLLDASRGCRGEPADDVTAMAINYLLFAAGTPRGWSALKPLWHRFWTRYLELHPDRVLTSVAPPFFAWRALVVCNPRFYPSMTVDTREMLLGLAECALDTHHFDPRWADEVVR